MRASPLGVLLVVLSACRSSSVSEPLGVVSAASPEAAEAGARILRAGGNAVDAAVAVAFALAVTEPAMSGLGGQTQIVLFRPDEGRAIALESSSFAPSSTPRSATQAELTGHRATTVPTSVAALDFALREYGSGRVSWAEEGFRVGPFRHKVFLRDAEILRASPSAAALFLDADGSAPGAGTNWKQPVLARTLRRLAEAGAADFYRGEIAASIVSDMESGGGYVSRQDLEAVAPPAVVRALEGFYRGYGVWTFPPPGGGWVVLRVLAELESNDSDTLKSTSARRGATLAQVLRAAHEARDAKEGVGETTHFAVVDRSGLAVSASASINNYFGARVASPELGFLYNDYMREFDTTGADPDHPFALAPLGKPYSSMSPTILTREGRVRLVLGSPGSERIISAVSQVTQLWVDAGLSIEEAVSHPRIHATGDGRLYLEPGISVEGADELGFRHEPAPDELSNGRLNPYFGGVHAIAFENGEWRGAADPRRDGIALVVSP